MYPAALLDPLADLKSELAAEEAADDKSGKKPVVTEPDPLDDEEADDGDAEGGSEEEAEGDDGESTDKEATAEDGEAADDKPPRKMVPAARAAEEANKRRNAVRDAAKERARGDALKAELDALRNPTQPKLDADGKPIPKTEDEIRAEIRVQERQRVRMEVLGENFANAGNKAYGEKEFEDACNDLSALGAPAGLIVLATEATDTPEQAAKAVFLLAQEDPKFIEKFFKLSPIKQATSLAKLAVSRTKKEAAEDEADDEEVKPKTKKAAAKPDVSRAPKPATPARGGRTTSDDFTDDMSEEEFTKKFNKDILQVRQ